MKIMMAILFFTFIFIGMFQRIKVYLVVCWCMALCVLLWHATCLAQSRLSSSSTRLSFPYASQRLTPRQAAAHLLNRFSYGATPQDIDRALSMGLEKWFEEQLDGKIPEDSLAVKLAAIPYQSLTNEEVLNQFPRPAHLLNMAVADGIIPKDSVKLLSKEETRRRLLDYAAQKKIGKQSDLIEALINQRLLRAIYSKNQLQEVMTGFWFNHFNVSLDKTNVSPLVPAYERDVIRPHVLDTFYRMLKATAQSPAMLVYLDNFISVGSNDSLLNPEGADRLKRLQQRFEKTNDSALYQQIQAIRERLAKSGLNENYAREIMELHTLGVDGGYSQQDVTEAARVLTGWSVYPLAIEESFASRIRTFVEQTGMPALEKQGFVRQGDFLFYMNRHDVRPKKVMNTVFPAGGGYAEGEQLLKLLSEHPSTAYFIARKLATYFVADTPTPILVKKMASTYRKTNGSIRAVLITMVNAKEFWSKASVRQKIKSPFELVVSACRVLKADVQQPYPLFRKLDQMGQKIYYYQAPTGFPDRASYWINTGSLLHRMNFGMDIAASRVRGLQVNVAALNNNHEPGDAEAALDTYFRLLLPERDPLPTRKRLLPLIHDVGFSDNLRKEVQKQKPVSNQGSMQNDQKADSVMEGREPDQDMQNIGKKPPVSAQTLVQVVGILIGSPEFQRR
jgi:uncharacterized protein (DUF1800 family)